MHGSANMIVIFLTKRQTGYCRPEERTVAYALNDGQEFILELLAHKTWKCGTGSFAHPVLAWEMEGG